MRNIKTLTYGWSGCSSTEDITTVLDALRRVRTVRRVSVSPTRFAITFDVDEVGPLHFQRALTVFGPYQVLGVVRSASVAAPLAARNMRRRRRRLPSRR